MESPPSPKASFADGLVESMETPLISRSSSLNSIENEVTNMPPSLSKPLQILYGFNGITLAFPMLALTYIVNTRVSMPLSDLSIYGALAFCPFSLKPLYAYLSSSSSKYYRHIWITILLLLNGMSTAGTAFIPNRRNNDDNDAVLICFLLALVRGVTSAWPEFLLGSTLIDQATSATNIERDPATSTVRQPEGYCLEQVVARFQSQAATARNLGSLTAHVGVIIILFLNQKLQGKDELTDGLVNTMLVVTGVWNITGAVVACLCKVGYPQRFLEQSQQPIVNDAAVSCSRNDGNVDINENNITENSALFHNNQCRCNTPFEEQADDELFVMSAHASMCCENRPQRGGGGDAVFIVALQVAIIVLILRTPLHNWLQPRHSSSHDHSTMWTIVIVVGAILSLLSLAAIVTFLCFRQELSHESIETSQRSSWQNEQQMQRYRVGLFLMLCHAMPSCTVVMSSFFYSMFQATPWVLQLCSLVDMAMTTLASWSYGRLLAPHCHGWLFVLVLAGTTVVSSLSELLFLLVTSGRHQGHRPTKAQTLGVILVKAVVIFFSEWRFLPDVVLATSSAAAAQTIDSTPSINSSGDLPTCCRPLASTSEGLDPVMLPIDDSEGDVNEQHNSNGDAVVGTSYGSLSVDPISSNQAQLWYGTLISCIDFGEQLGSWMTVPLVAALNITRENEWAHLNVLIRLSSGFGIVTLMFIAILKTPAK